MTVTVEQGNMRINRLLAAHLMANLLLSVSCGTVATQPKATVMATRSLQAYGRVWSIVRVLKTRSPTYPELITGERSDGRWIQYLIDNQGNKVDVSGSIYSLRRSGAYVQYASAGSWAGASMKIFEADGKLFIELVDRPSAVTDCPIYPPMPFVTHTEYAKSYASEAGIFFGVFDPSRKVFMVNEYVRDFDFSDYQTRSKMRGFDDTKYMFAQKTPFNFVSEK